jgi:hypothetical protein
MPGTEQYAELVRQWFESGFSVIAPEQLAALESGPKLPPEAIRRSMPCGPPGATWGFVSVTRYYPKRITKAGRQTFEHKGSARVWTARSWSWFLGQLADPPHDATLGTAHLQDENGDEPGYPESPRVRMLAFRDKLAADWLRLSFDAPETSLNDPDRQQSWLAFIREIVDNLNPAFGIVDYEYDFLYGQTAVEATVADLSIALTKEGKVVSRRVLRGYDWLTICPQELVARLGGVRALAASGAFHQVEELRGGGLWLLATADYRDYDEAATDRVFRALAPVLPGGLPVHHDPRQVERGYDYRIVYLDAAEVGRQ